MGINKASAGLANGGSLFWIVHPEIGAAGVTGLDTLVSRGSSSRFARDMGRKPRNFAAWTIRRRPRFPIMAARLS